MSSVFVSSNITIEEESKYTSDELARSSRNYEYIPIDVQRIIDRNKDVNKTKEISNYINKHYGESIRRENFLSNWSDIHKNAKVYKLLLSGMYTELSINTPTTEVTKWFDYSIYILHYLKAIEKFWVYKLNKKSLLTQKENERITMHKIIEKIKLNKDKLLNKDVPEFVEKEFFRMLEDFAHIYRNGYVHRDYLSYEKAIFIKDMIINILVLTDITFE